MTDELTAELDRLARRALQVAARSGSKAWDLEHLLLALLDEPAVARLITSADADVERVRRRLAGLVAATEPPGLELGPAATLVHKLRLSARRVQKRLGVRAPGAPRGAAAILPSPNVQRVIQRAMVTGARASASGEDVLRGMLTAIVEGESPAAQAWRAEVGATVAPEPLAAYTTTWPPAEAAARPLHGGEATLARLEDALACRQRNWVFLVGGAGVGKTALVHALAARLAGPLPGTGSPVRALDLDRLLAGQPDRAGLDGRAAALAAALVARPELVLAIDDLARVRGTSSAPVVAGLLRLLAAEARVRVVLVATPEEEALLREQDRTITARVRLISLAEPDVATTVAVLRGQRALLEHDLGVRLSPRALRVAAESAPAMPAGRLRPASAFDLLDEAAARVRRRRSSGPGSVPLRVTGADVERARRGAGGGERSPAGPAERARLLTLADVLKRSVLGQERAIDQVVDVIRMSRVGLGEPRRPVGCFLFAGPTGVGKTELARQLAAQLTLPLLRFDMSEYVERHAVARLIGAPPGYVGSEQGGLLTDGVRQQPRSVVLLDEIEKADTAITNLLLQVMDHGALTDNRGRTTCFTEVVLIMTSNVGAQEQARTVAGFGTRSGAHAAEAAYRRTFLPELRNRLDAKIDFAPLDARAMAAIVDTQLARLVAALARRQVGLEVSAEARAQLAQRGHDPQLGARPLLRLIERELKRPLTDAFLHGRLPRHARVRVDGAAGGLTLEMRTET